MDSNMDILLIISKSQLVRYNILEAHDDSLVTLLHYMKLMQWTYFLNDFVYWIRIKQGIDVYHFLEFYDSYLIALNPFYLIYWTELFKVYLFYGFSNQHLYQFSFIVSQTAHILVSYSNQTGQNRDQFHQNTVQCSLKSHP